jgi:kynurenine formamidase
VARRSVPRGLVHQLINKTQGPAHADRRPPRRPRRRLRHRRRPDPAAVGDHAGPNPAGAVRQHAAPQPRAVVQVRRRHWITGRDGDDVASIPPARLVGPLRVVDKTAETAADPGYLLTAQNLQDHEAEHGPIEPGTWIVFRTGWGSRANDEAAFLNAGDEGPVTPGPDVEASRWLADHPNIVGFGVETVGIDAGAAGGFDPGFPVHNFLLGAGRYGLTQLANADRLPPTGALIVVAPLKLVDGTGSPARVLAFVPST